MKIQEKIEALKKVKNEEEIHNLLAELLPFMGYGQTFITHERGNAPENGKDLIASIHDPIEDKEDWTAFVVKKGNIAGKSVVINEVEAQAQDCFKYPYKSIVRGTHIRINKVKVVTNGTISNGAETKILANQYFDKANVAFWDGEKLANLITKYYPQYWIKGSKQYKDYIDKLFETIQADNISKTLGIKNKKLQSLIDRAIELNLNEIIKEPDGSINHKSFSSSSIIRIPDNSIIIGPAGCGKSTLFKALAKEIIEQNSLRDDTEFYPIILTFRILYDADFDLKKAIEKHLTTDLFKDLDIDLTNLFENQNFVLFIDALDEVAKIELKEKALNSIKDFKEDYHKVKIFCSSRNSDYLLQNCQSLGFKYLEVDELNRKQIEQFISKYFAEDVIRSKKLLKSLQDSGILDKLPKTPLTLSLISIIFDSNEVEIPATIADLYASFVELLLGKNSIRESMDFIEIGVKKRYLSYLAKDFHTKNKTSLPLVEVKSTLSSYFENRALKVNEVDFLDSIIEDSGLVFVNDRDELQFKHLSFQEYFTAYEYYHHKKHEQQIFINNFNSIWWQNVAIFYAGMTKDSPELIEEILSNSKPKNFQEAIINIGGLGHLMQALYNTPVSSRLKGLERSVESTLYAENAILNLESNDPLLDFWRRFSKYGISIILGYWFNHTHSSMTLVEPIKQLFQKCLNEKKEGGTNEDSFLKDYELFLLASTIGNAQFLEFEPLLKLIENRNSNDFSMSAIIDSHVLDLNNTLSSNLKDSEIIKAIKDKNKKLMMLIGDVHEEVNIPIGEIEDESAYKKKVLNQKINRDKRNRRK